MLICEGALSILAHLAYLACHAEYIRIDFCACMCMSVQVSAFEYLSSLSSFSLVLSFLILNAIKKYQ